MAGKRNKEKLYEVSFYIYIHRCSGSDSSRVNVSPFPLSLVLQVEGIVDERDINGKMEYKVHWKGYADSEDSWEPEANLKQCKDIIEEYRAGKVC